MSDDIAMFKTLIRQRYGLTLEGFDEERLHVILHSARKTYPATSHLTLRQFLQQKPDIFDELISQLTVNETYFFREPGQLALAVDTIIPRLLPLLETSRKLQILSAGCSSGEEPYSLAIALTESWGEQTLSKVEIHACDLDQEILRKAARGLYSTFSFRGVDQNIRQRYFEPVGQRFKLVPELRQLVRFFELNLMADAYPDHLPRYDLIFFRNVSIYFDLTTRTTILQKLSNLLADDGVLIVGSSETLANDLGVFKLVEEQGQYYFIKGQRLIPPGNRFELPANAASAPSFAPPAVPLPAPNPDSLLVAPHHLTELHPVTVPPMTTAQHPVADSDVVSVADLRELILQDEGNLALGQLQLLLGANILQGSDRDRARLLTAWILGNRREFPKAQELVKSVLDEQPWSPDALLLMGLLMRWQGHHQDALDWLKKAAYSDPDCWPACYYLAETQRALQQPAATRSYQIVRRLLSHPHAETGLDILPLSLTEADALYLTEHQLMRLKRLALTPGVS